MISIDRRCRLWACTWFVALGMFLALSALKVHAGLVISDLGKTYLPDPNVTPAWLSQHIANKDDVIGGNTSVRNVDTSGLKWKGSSKDNGFGYFQRNRDLGQVFNVPAGEKIKIDAIVLRTARGNDAVMKGAPGSRMYVQFFEVGTIPGETIRINENGTTVGQQATHGFDLGLNRCDDFIEGASYRLLARATGGIFPAVAPTTQYVYNTGSGPYGEQEGHLRFFRFDMTGSDELVLDGGKRYAFIAGFEQPGPDRGIGLAITTEVHTKAAAVFVVDAKGVNRWGIRREGDGTLPPTMAGTATPSTDQTLLAKLIAESMFAPDHWNSLMPTSDGYPDVDTYRTLQFYIETKPVPEETGTRGSGEKKTGTLQPKHSKPRIQKRFDAAGRLMTGAGSR
jgi:hypothetical protein